MPWGEAMPQVEQPAVSPWWPAKLTPEKPRARARLMLNVKDFDMGEASP